MDWSGQERIILTNFLLLFVFILINNIYGVIFIAQDSFDLIDYVNVRRNVQEFNEYGGSRWKEIEINTYKYNRQPSLVKINNTEHAKNSLIGCPLFVSHSQPIIEFLQSLGGHEPILLLYLLA